MLEASLGVMAGLIDTIAIDRERMRRAADEGYTTATAVADSLVRRGVPFRAAHHIVGGLVGEAERRGGVALDALPDDVLAAALAASDDERAQALAADPGAPAALRAAAEHRRRARERRRDRRHRAATRPRGPRGGSPSASIGSSPRPELQPKRHRSVADPHSRPRAR